MGTFQFITQLQTMIIKWSLIILLNARHILNLEISNMRLFSTLLPNTIH